MALYKKVNGQLVKVNSAMDDAIKFIKESIKKGKDRDDAIQEAASMYGLTPYEIGVLQQRSD